MNGLKSKICWAMWFNLRAIWKLVRAPAAWLPGHPPVNLHETALEDSQALESLNQASGLMVSGFSLV